MVIHPSHCARHTNRKTEVRRPTRRCLKCSELATYGIDYPIHCEAHSCPGDMSFETSRCSSCGLEGIVDEKCLCRDCNPERFLKVKLAKQNEVVDYLETHDIPLDIVDHPVDSKCGLERQIS